jgi:hypothetical protein
MNQLDALDEPSVDQLRERCQGVSVEQFLDEARPDLSRRLIDLIQVYGGLGLSYFLVDRVTDDLGRDFGDRVKQYAKRHFDDDLTYPNVIVSWLLFLFRLPCGVELARDIARQRHPELALDKDGLTITGASGQRWVADGLIVGGDYLQLSPWLIHYNLSLSGGFMETLLAARASHGDAVRHFGIALRPHVVMARVRHMPIFTRAREFGPPRISVEILRSPRFPERPDGVVTRHVRTIDDIAWRTFYPDYEALEVMWSAKDGLKTVNIEELVSTSARRSVTRYSHAQWDVATERMVHFDGAVRVYEHHAYQSAFHRKFPARRHCGQRYIKLFRLDAPLTLDEWAPLVARFFRGNEMIVEYLGDLAAAS